MKHLLVPLDGSDLGASVVPVARTLALTTGATVRLVTVEQKATPLGSARAAATYLDGLAEACGAQTYRCKRTYALASQHWQLSNGRASAGRNQLPGIAWS